MKNKDLTVSDIFEKLTDEQKKWAYYCIGTAVEGKSPRRFKKYRELMESVDDISKKVINELIDKALEEREE